jgi:hypothetical protein
LVKFLVFKVRLDLSLACLSLAMTLFLGELTFISKFLRIDREHFSC